MTTCGRTRTASAILVVSALWLSACDSAPGVYDSQGAPPRVSGLAFSPDRVVFDELGPDQVIGDSVALIELSIQVQVADGEDDVEAVRFVVNTPFDPFSPLATGELVRSGGGAYSVEENIVIKRGNEGRYTILVYAVDAEGNLSNQARGILDYSLGAGRAPVIEAIEGPDSIRPPVTLTLIAVVSDPDGLGNIARVVVTAPNGGTFDMFDDGETLGDEVAGDGRYTARFDVPSAEPGTFTFKFQAFDRSGLSSDVVTKDITVLGL